MRILLTNDDGVDSPGLHALHSALSGVGEVMTVAPDRNRSAIARKITIDRPLTVEERTLPGGAPAFATDGTPVDCVRLAMSGLAGPTPDVIVSGANLGLNVGDDITYSGTVAAALEGLLLGIPAIAVSQQPLPGQAERWEDREFDFTLVTRVVTGLLPKVASRRFPHHVLLNVNAPGLAPEEVAGVRVTRLGRRTYEDRLVPADPHQDGRNRYWVYSTGVSHEGGDETDVAAVAGGWITVTPLHFDLTDLAGMDGLERWQIEHLHLELPTG